MNIRKTPKAVDPVETLPQSQEDSTVAWLRANRHTLGPFKAGQVITKTADGFRPVQPRSAPPVEVATQIKEAEMEVIDLPADKDVTPLKIPAPVNFKDLSSEKQAAIYSALDTGTAKLSANGLGGVKTAPVLSTLKVEHPVEPKTTKNSGLPEDFVNGPDIIGFMDGLREKEAKAETEPIKPEDKEPTPSAGGVPEHTNCQHCGWDLKKQDPEDPSDIDKLNFVQSILGQLPFAKAYSLLGGKVQIEFRSLSSEESDATFTQTAYDAGRGEILEEGHYFRTLTDYRMCLGLASYKAGDKCITLPHDIDAWETDATPAKATKLVHIVPWVYENVLKVESIRRAVAACYFRFQRLVERLEAHVDDPNFWQAIEK